MKKRFSIACFLIALTSIGYSQSIAFKDRLSFSVGAGRIMPSSALKADSYLTNSPAFIADVCIDLFGGPLGSSTSSGYSFGLNFGGTFMTGDSTDSENALPTALPIIGGTGTNVVYKTVDPRNPGFKTGLGPQANFHFGDNLTVSTMVLGEFFNMTQKEQSVVQTTTVNGQINEFTLVKMPEAKTSGFAITPKIRLQYMITKNIGLFAEGAYTTGPKVETTYVRLVPLGNIEPAPINAYDLQQLQFGKSVVGETKVVPFSAMSVGAGVMVRLGKGRKIVWPVSEATNSTAYKGRKIIWPVAKAQEDTVIIRNDNKILKGKVTKMSKADSGKQIQSELPAEIQNLIKEQDSKLNKAFEQKPSNKKTNSLCNFKFEELDIQCSGKDAQGNKKYHVVIAYKNLSLTGTSGLGNYLTACSIPSSNGPYLNMSGATVSSLTPSISASTIIAPGANQLVSFDMVPTGSTLLLNIKGYNISSPISCGNCEDLLELKLPNCCYPCDENPVVANGISTEQFDAINGKIRIVNSISTPKNVVRIDTDIVSVKYIPKGYDCTKCNNQIKNQDNFVGVNNISGTGWDNSGNPTFYLGELTASNTSRSLVFNSTSPTGINLATPINITHTIGVSPNSCCGDDLEIWIKYSVWDKDCHVCQKIIKSTISREGSCTGNSNGDSTGTNIPNKN